eukprot:gene34161-37687_t
MRAAAGAPAAGAGETGDPARDPSECHVDCAGHAPHGTVEPAGGLPHGWRSVGPSPRSQQVELVFAVKQTNTAELHDALMRVSDPTSPDYGRHLSNAEVHALVAPDPAAIDAVERHIRVHGGAPRRVSPNGDFVATTVTAEAGSMLAARYPWLAHNATGAAAHRCVGGYGLPPNVAAAVDFVAPTVHQAVTAFLGQYYSKSGMPKLVGDATTGSPGVESMLDIESITGVGGNIESEFWGFGG